METKKPEEGAKVVKERLWEALQANWKIWPLAQAVNFSVIPL